MGNKKSITFIFVETISLLISRVIRNFVVLNILETILKSHNLIKIIMKLFEMTKITKHTN